MLNVEHGEHESEHLLPELGRGDALDPLAWRLCGECEADGLRDRERREMVIVLLIVNDLSSQMSVLTSLAYSYSPSKCLGHLLPIQTSIFDVPINMQEAIPLVGDALEESRAPCSRSSEHKTHLPWFEHAGGPV